MSGTPSRHQGNLAGLELPTLHERRMLTHTHDVGMRRAESGKTFAGRIFGIINQLLHPGLPVMVASASGVLDQPCDFLGKLAQ